ncbi:MAG: SDR family NAD(P)-dependent oxidoreductase [Vulcanimicrobiota bacterium]
MRLKGKKAVVTGGGRGIGAAVAEELARQGCEVVVAARTLCQLESVVEAIKGPGGVAHAVECDVTDPDSVAAMAMQAKELMGSVHILVNNAGIASSAPLKSLTLQEWNRILSVNTTGTYLCTQAFLPAMSDQKWGRVINVASVAGQAGAKYISAYSSSKHAVIGFTRCIALEVAPKGVTVNAVCPGYVDTDLTGETVDRIIEKTGMTEQDAIESLARTNPQHRLIQPDEVAYLVLCLCDERARGINGQAINIDGGGLA